MENRVSERARAKINLTLHVGKTAGGGLHPLESLVMFAAIGDEITARKSGDGFSLTIDGPFSAGLSAGDDNLVLKAARDRNLLDGLQLKGAQLHLTKNLPIASGIGGGSADAAAAARCLARLHSDASSVTDYLMLEIGADVPVCFYSKTCMMGGVGEDITPMDNAGQLHCILVNPAIEVSTADIFRAYDKAFPKPHEPLRHRSGAIMEIALAGHNDLEPIACALAPQITDVLKQISAQAGVQLSRMSGSGATCFGIFKTAEQAESARGNIAKNNPNYWVVATLLGEAA